MATIEFRTAQKRIATTWFICGGILFLIFVLQSVLGKYGDDTEKAWNWLLPAIMPTISLITAVLVTELSSPNKGKMSDRFLYRMAIGSSAIYISILYLMVFLSPFIEGDKTALEILESSQLWVAPLQGVVVAILGAFFVKPQSEPEE
jgi:cytochrome bd-type quinol oxidase subunit 2